MPSDFDINRARVCMYSELALTRKVLELKPDYTCTRDIPATAPHNTVGPPCALLLGLECEHHEQFPEAYDQ